MWTSAILVNVQFLAYMTMLPMIDGNKTVCLPTDTTPNNDAETSSQAPRGQAGSVPGGSADGRADGAAGRLFGVALPEKLGRRLRRVAGDAGGSAGAAADIAILRKQHGAGRRSRGTASGRGTQTWSGPTIVGSIGGRTV